MDRPIAAPERVPGVDPSVVNTPLELAQCLDGLRRRRGLSYEQMEKAARTIRRADGHETVALGKSTVGEIVNGKRFPTRPKFLVFLSVCQIAGPDLAQWLAAWERASTVELMHPPATAGACPEGPPGADNALIEYLTLVQDYFQQLNLEMLLTMTSVEERLRVPLQRVFIPPLVRADPPAVELPREFRRRLLDGDEADPWALTRDLGPEILGLARHAYEQQQPRSVLDLVSTTEHRCLVLLGDPGSGKSTTARYLILRLAQLHPAMGGVQAMSDPLSILAGSLPLLVELRLYSAASSASFLDYLEQVHAAQGLGLPQEELIRRLDGGGPVVIVFDGLDEIIDRDRRAAVHREIREFSRRYPNARVVVTSRPVGYQRQVLDDAGFKLYQLQDLASDQIDSFVRAWYRIACPDDQTEAERLTERITSAVRRSPAVNELAGNPLLLTLLCVMCRRRELPRDRMHVYEYAVSLLVEHWDVEAHSFPNKEGLIYDDKLDLLRLLARAMLLGEGSLGGNRITEQDLREIFETYLEGERGYSRPVARTAAQSMILQLRTRNYILSRFGAGMYGFVHRSFLEYLAALDIAHRFDNRLLDEARLLETFERHGGDPAWTEVLLLLVRMKEQFAGAILDRLLTADQAWRFDEAHTPAHSLLAVRALHEIRPSARLNRQVERVMARVLEILRELETEPDGALQAALRESAKPTFVGLTHGWYGARLFRAWHATEGRYLAGPVAALAAELNAPLTEETDLLRDARSDADSLVRCAAVEAMAAHRDWSADAYPELVRRLRTDPASDVRVTSARTLAARWSTEPEVSNLLRRHAEEDDEATVRQVCLELLDTAAEDAADTLRAISLRRAEEDPDPRVRTAAVVILARRYPNDPVAVALLGRILREDPNAEVRQVAVEGIANAAVDVARCRELVMESSVDDVHRSVRRSAVRALSAAGTNWSSAHEVLADRAAADPDAGVRSTALEGIIVCRLAAGAIRRLLTDRAVEDPHWSVRRTALQLLSGMWSHHPDTMVLLEHRATEDADEDVRIAALLGVSSPLLDSSSTAHLLMGAYAADPSPSVRSKIVDMLSDAAIDSATVRQHLLAVAANDLDWSVRRHAVRVIGTRWADDETVQTQMFHLAATDSDEDVRRQALAYIGEHWQDQPRTHAFLVERSAVDDSDLVRKAALGYLLVGWREDPRTLGILSDHAARDEDESIRRAALRAVATTWPNNPRVRSLLEQAAEGDPDWLVRRTAGWLILHAWRENPETVAFMLRRLLADPSADVRRSAAQGLAAQAPGASLIDPSLRQAALSDVSATVRCAALQGVANSWPDRPATITLLVRLADNDAHTLVRSAAVRVLARWAFSEEARAAISRRADEDRDPNVRRLAGEVLTLIES